MPRTNLTPQERSEMAYTHLAHAEALDDTPGYMVCPCGHVISLPKKGGYSEPTVLSTGTHRKGHQGVGLVGGRRAQVHRLIARAFLGDSPPGKPFVLHKDGDPGNNAVSNLYFGTHAENMRDMVSHGRSTRGERSGTAKLTADQVRGMRDERACGATYSQLAKKYGVSSAAVCRILLRRTWVDA